MQRSMPQQLWELVVYSRTWLGNGRFLTDSRWARASKSLPQLIYIKACDIFVCQFTCNYSTARIPHLSIQILHVIISNLYASLHALRSICQCKIYASLFQIYTRTTAVYGRQVTVNTGHYQPYAGYGSRISNRPTVRYMAPVLWSVHMVLTVYGRQP